MWISYESYKYALVNLSWNLIVSNMKRRTYRFNNKTQEA